MNTRALPPRPLPSLGLAIGLMVLGAVLGVASVILVTLPLLKLARDAPTVTTPGSVTLHLDRGLYKVFEPIGTASAGTAIRVPDVHVSGPGGSGIPVTEARADEVIARGPRHYASTVAFRVSVPGGYTVRIVGAPGEVVISRSLADAVRSRVGWVAGIPIGGLLALIGLLLLIVRVVRRSRATRADSPGAP